MTREIFVQALVAKNIGGISPLRIRVVCDALMRIILNKHGIMLVVTVTGVVLEIQSIPTLFVTDRLTKKNQTKDSAKNSCSNLDV